MQFHIDGMTCGGCARSVTKAIQEVDPQATVVADPPSRQVKVESTLAPAQIVAALREAGYPPREA